MPTGPYKTITIKEETHQLLRREAIKNHRTMASQLLHILTQRKTLVDKKK